MNDESPPFIIVFGKRQLNLETTEKFKLRLVEKNMASETEALMSDVVVESITKSLQSISESLQDSILGKLKDQQLKSHIKAAKMLGIPTDSIVQFYSVSNAAVPIGAKTSKLLTAL